MGYQKILIPAGHTIFTVTFDDVNGEGYSFNNISVVNAAGQEYDDLTDGVGRLRDRISCQAMDFTSGGLTNDTYKYTTQIPVGGTEMNRWKFNESLIKDMEPAEQAKHVLKNGAAIYVKNIEKSKPVYLRFAGQVRLTPLSFELKKGHVLIGNMTPCPVAIKDIKVGTFIDKSFVEYDDLTDGVGRLRDKISCQMMDLSSGGLTNDTYKYTTQIPVGGTEMNGWKFNGSLIKDMEPAEQAKHVLQPGQGFYLKYTEATKSAWLKFPEPIKKE